MAERKRKAAPAPPDPPTLPLHEEPEPLLITRGDQVAGRRWEFLWHQRYALGSVGCLCGRKGTGKSTIAATVAADVTGGPRLDRGRRRVLGHVLWYAAEEPVAAAARPRLEACGANLEHVSWLGCDRQGRQVVRPSLPGDYHRLRATMQDCGARLLVLDPWTGCLGPGTSLNDEQSLRLALEPLTTLADELRALILLGAHVRKEGHGPALDQILGGVAVVNVSRSVLRCDRDPLGKGGYLLSTVATNFGGELAPTLTFAVDADPPGRLRWTGTSDLDADTLSEGAGDSAERDERVDARTLLRRTLASERVPSQEVLNEAARAGISPRTLRRAKAELHVVSHVVRTSSGKTSHWEWGPPRGGWPEGG